MDKILRYHQDYLSWERLYSEYEALKNSCDPQWENLQEEVFEALANPLPDTYSVDPSGRLVPIGPANLLEVLPKEEELVCEDPAEQLERLIAFGKQSAQKTLQKELASQIEQESQDMQTAHNLMKQSGEVISIMTGEKLRSYPSLDFSYGEATHDLRVVQEELEMGNFATAAEHYLFGRNQLAALAVYEDGRRALKDVERQEKIKGLGILIASAAGGHLFTSGAILAGFAPEVAATFVAPFGFLTTSRAFHGNLWNPDVSTGENLLDWGLDYATTASMFKYVGVTARGLVGETAGPIARYGAESVGFATWSPMENIFHQAISGQPFDEQQLLKQTASPEALLDQQITLLALKAGGYPLRGVMKPLDRLAIQKSIEHVWRRYADLIKKGEYRLSPIKNGVVTLETGSIGKDLEDTLPTKPLQSILRIVDEEIALLSSPRKTLIVVNAKDLDALRMAMSDGRSTERFRESLLRQPWLNRGVARGYEWEAILTGKITLTTRDLTGTPSETIDDAVNRWFPYDKQRLLERGVDPFDRAYRVFPDASGDLEKDLRSVIAKTGGSADSEHTTLVMLYGHGDPGAIQIGLTRRISYGELIDALDQIPGRKVLIVCACYSGSCIPVVQGHPNSGDYAVITSTGRDEAGSSWLDDIFHEELQRAFLRGGELSRMRVETLSNQMGSQTAQTFFGFDDRL